MMKRIYLIATICYLLSMPALLWAGQAILSWDANTENDLAGYKVYYGTASRIYGSPIDVVLITQYTISNLPPGIHYFAVTAYDTSGNESGFSNEVFKVIITGITTQVLGITETGTSPQLILNWDAPNIAIGGYKIYQGNTPGIYNTTYDIGGGDFASTTCITETYMSCERRTFTLNGLGAGTYYFAVSAYNVFGQEGVPSNQVSKTIVADTVLPADVTNFTATQLAGKNTIRLSWTNPTDPDFSRLILEYSFNGNSFIELVNLAATPGEKQTYDYMNPLPGTYNYAIHAVDAFGNTTNTARTFIDTAQECTDCEETFISPISSPPSSGSGGGGGCGFISSNKKNKEVDPSLPILLSILLLLIFFKRKNQHIRTT